MMPAIHAAAQSSVVFHALRRLPAISVRCDDWVAIGADTKISHLQGAMLMRITSMNATVVVKPKAEFEGESRRAGNARGTFRISTPDLNHGHHIFAGFANRLPVCR